MRAPAVARQLLCAGLAFGSSSGAAAQAPVAPVAPVPTRDRLRQIVQDECVPHFLQQHDPAPCVRVVVEGRGAQSAGVAALADRKSGAHFLLIPIPTMLGIESPEARASGVLNYFAAAWDARDVLATVVGREVPAQFVGLAVNQRAARSQDQMHIHVSCLGRPVYEAFTHAAARIGTRWSALEIGGWRYQALRIMGTDLNSANPVELLAAGVPGAGEALEQYTMLVAGARFAEGPGFILLAAAAVPGAELLLDAGCALALKP